MASSTIVTDLTIHTAHIRLRSGKYMLVYYTNEYDEDGNPINITIYDSSETLIENPPYEIIYEVTKTIPPPEGDWLNNLWFKNGVNSLSPRQSPGQTNNIFLGFETAENFDLSDLVTYSGDHNFIAGYQLASSLTTGSYNTIFGEVAGGGLTTGSFNTLFGYNVANSLSTHSGNTVFGSNIAPLATSLQYSTLFGGNIASNATDLRFTFIAGYDNLKNATGLSQYSFINGNSLANGGNVQYSFINGYQQMQTSSGVTFAFASGFLNFNGSGDVYGSSASGRENFKSNTGQVLYSNAFGRDNFFSSASASYSNAFGYQNLYTATSPFASTGIGEGNLKLSSDADYSIGIGYRNLYTSTSSNNNVIALGRENGYNNVSHANSIYLGYRQGYTTGSANRLMIGMAQDDPLLSGHFTNDWIRVDGYLEVRDKTGVTSGNIVVWDGDKLVDSGSAITSFTGGYWRESAGVLYSHETSGVRDIVVADIQFTDRGSTPVGLVGRDSANWLENIAVGTGLALVGSTLTANVVDDPEWTNIAGVLYSDYNPGSALTLKDIKVNEIEFVLDAGASPTTLIGRNSSGRISGVTIGSGLSFSSGILSATGSSLWTDEATYYRPNNLSNIASNSFRIYDTGRVTIGGTSDPTPYLLSVNGIGRFTSGVSLNGDLEFTNSSDIVFDSGGSGNIVDTNGQSGTKGEVLSHDGGGVVWFDKGIAWGLRTTTNTTSTTFTTLFLTSGTSDYGNITASTSTFTVNNAGIYKIIASGENASTADCEIAVYYNGIQSYTINIGTGDQSFCFHDMAALSSSTTVGLRFRAVSGTAELNNVVFSVECIRLD